jgi:TRAP-type C4-dicarboxylate transport system substrate-binding protein
MANVFATMVSCLLLVASYSVVADASSQQWKIGHVRPAGSAVDKDVHNFVAQIKSETNGTIQIDVYPASKLGDYSIVQERVSFGEVEMFVGPFGTAIDKRVSLAFAPFIVSTWAEAKEVYFQGSALFSKMAEFLEAQNIKLVGGWPVYFGGIALTQKPVQPGNPDVSKETIIRVPPIRSFERTARALGYTPYPITWTYAKMGLKTGMVKGILGGGAEGYIGLKGMIKYYLPINDHFEYWFVYMNLDLWNGLPEKTKLLILDLWKDIESQRYSVAERDERDSIERLSEMGVTIITLSEKQQSYMKEKVKKEVWPEMRREIGEDFDLIAKQPY